MGLYAFELGRKKNLCFAELCSVLGKENLLERNLDTAIFKLNDFDATALQNRLGGTIKIMEVFAEVSSLSEIEDKIGEFLSSHFKEHSGKMNFSVSYISFFKVQQHTIKGTLIFIKKFLKSLGIGSRYVNTNFENAKPSTIYKARVLEKGVDICVIQGGKSIFLGASISIQDIDAYSQRDFGKPKRDAKVGMLPPKLAQIMINLAGNPKTIFDPFCGTGTILMEGLLMGKTVVGSDIDSKMVDYSKENCHWIAKEFGTAEDFRVFQKDAQLITKNDLPERIDAVVSETYLGKPLSKLPQENERKQTFRSLLTLHSNWLHGIHPFLPKNCKIVVCILAYKKDRVFERMHGFIGTAERLGYKVISNHIYDRPDQIAARDIYVLEKIS